MWSKRFNKNELTARQCSPRGGNVGLRVHVDETSDDKGKLFISGEDVKYIFIGLKNVFVWDVLK